MNITRVHPEVLFKPLKSAAIPEKIVAAFGGRENHVLPEKIVIL